MNPQPYASVRTRRALGAAVGLACLAGVALAIGPVDRRAEHVLPTARHSPEPGASDELPGLHVSPPHPSPPHPSPPRPTPPHPSPPHPDVPHPAPPHPDIPSPPPLRPHVPHPEPPRPHIPHPS